MVEKEITKGRKTKTYFAMRFEQGDTIQDETVKKRIAELQQEVLSQFSPKKEEVKEETIESLEEELKYPEDKININSIYERN